MEQTINPIIAKYDELIKNAMKARETEKLSVYRYIKKNFLDYKTQPGTPVLDEAAEIKILNKMAKELQGDIEERQNANVHLDEIPGLELQLTYIKELLPQAATEDDVKAIVEKYIAENGNYSQKEMGKVMAYVRNNIKNADGGMTSKIVKSYIK